MISVKSISLRKESKNQVLRNYLAKAHVVLIFFKNGLKPIPIQLPPDFQLPPALAEGN